MAAGKTLAEARHLGIPEIRAQLNGIAPEHLPPRLWALEGLLAAIAVYDGTEVTCDEEKDSLVCRCHGVSENTAKQSVTIGGATSLEDMVVATKAGSGCGSCKPDLIKILDEATKPAEEPAAKTPAKAPVMGRIQTLLRIQRSFEARLAAGLRESGGDLELWDFDGRLVHVRLRGSLIGNDAAARQALSDLEHLLKAEIDREWGVTLS